MGRRPNAVVAEFFDRGAKLHDSSNRYEHTCRRCGELFPKGRLDNLLKHLTKQCPNLSQDDRHSIAQHVQAASYKHEDRSAQLPDHSGLPISLDRQQSALDTLAEVSRRHLDYSAQRNAVHDAVLLHDDQALAEQALWTQLQQHTMNMAPASNQGMYDLQMPGFGTADFSGVANDTAQLSQPDLAALAALDPQLGTAHSFDLPADLNMLPDQPKSTQSQSKDAIQWTPQLTSTEPRESFNSLLLSQKKASRAKQRGRFTETRRKEVQELRKRGACIRCRMLKKPCSEGTPCNTCASVDTARIWKGQCVRTRLSEEFPAWSAGYFQSRSVLFQPEHSSEVLSVTVNVKIGIDEGAGLELSAIYDASMQTTVDPALNEVSKDAQGRLRLMHEDELSDRIAAYLSDQLYSAVTNEQHSFLSVTLQQALDLVNATEARRNDDKPETRTCYNIPVGLIRDVLELWTLTMTLTGSHTFTVQAAISQDIDYTGCQAQLLAAVETRAARLSQKVLNDLERRLLQRQQVSGFETFIAAVILLSSVERMTAFYQALDSDTTTWSLEMSAQSIWSRGPSFAALLTMLLRIRGLPPRTFENESGKLAVLYEPSDKLHKVNGSTNEAKIRALDEARHTALANWLEKCSLGGAEVRSWVESTADGWYGKFMAALLLN